MNSTNDWANWINNNYKSTIKSIKESNTYSKVSTTIESLPGSPEEKKVVGMGIGEKGAIVGAGVGIGLLVVGYVTVTIPLIPVAFGTLVVGGLFESLRGKDSEVLKVIKESINKDK